VLLPSSPGVYWFLDENNAVIYVGKAKNLKNRLHSYSLISKLLPKTKQLVTHTQRVKYKILPSELEALLVEAELIRLHQPHYNILLKDDKSPLYIVTTKETFPKVLSVRKSDIHSGTVRINRMFGPLPSGYQVREVLKITRRLFPYCNATSRDKTIHKPCFYSHIGLCPGACTGKIKSTVYKQNIKHLELFLQGKHASVVKALTQKINEYAKNEEFETANVLKSKINSIKYITEHYKNRITEKPLPNLTDDLNHQREIELIRLLHTEGVKIDKINRIEMYDVSNLQGKSATVSMVVAINSQIDHREYKHFSVKTLDTPNDPKMLKEILIRRQNHPEWGTPDIIILDGGKSQMNAVASILKWPCLLLGLAKNPDRLLITISKNPLKVVAIHLDPSNPAGGLLISLRDEAHRFSRRLHHLHATKKLLNQ
jgi:excinuclease ABC subunit C